MRTSRDSCVEGVEVVAVAEGVDVAEDGVAATVAATVAMGAALVHAIRRTRARQQAK